MSDRMWQVMASWGSTLVDDKNLAIVRDALHDAERDTRGGPAMAPADGVGWRLVRFKDLTGGEYVVQVCTLHGYTETSVEIKKKTKMLNDLLIGDTEEEHPWDR